jgi:membrane-associated phospholipid phosphatase
MVFCVWHALTYIGDGAVLMPCAVLFFAWLISAPFTRRAGWCWLVAVLLVGGGVALSKVLYMVSGWHPAGWNFIGLSGHAALSFLFWPSAGAFVPSRNRTWLRVITVGLGAALALAISAASWVLGYHSLSEVVVGGLWGAMVATVFLLLTWRKAEEAPLARKWMIASMLLLVLVAFGHEFPSKRVLSWIACRVDGHTALYMRANVGPKA